MLLETGLELLEPRLCGERRSNVAVHVLEVDQPWLAVVEDREKGSEVGIIDGFAKYSSVRVQPSVLLGIKPGARQMPVIL